MNLVRIIKMPLQFRIKKGLLGFGGRLGIIDRPKGEKIPVESSGSGFPARKSIELQEDILGGGVLSPSEQLPSGADSVPEDVQLLVAVIRRQELVIRVNETSQEPSPDPDHEVECAVLKAASEGRWEEINQVFNRPGQQERVLHAQNEFGWSPLHFAVYYGHRNIVNQLVNVCRLPPEQKTKEGRTPLMVASGAGHLPVAKLLLETHQSNVNEEDSESATAVLYAARRGHLPVMKVLLAHGADVFHKAKASFTALHLAAYGGSIECLEYLLPLFGDRRFETNESGGTCLHYAVAGGSVPMVRYLVDQCGFDLGLRTADGATPLMLAAVCGHLAVAELLVETYRCDVNAEDNDEGLTPLMVAAGYGHLAVAKLLVETYRCDVNEEDSKSVTPVMYAAQRGHLPVLKMLVEHGANVLHKAEDGVTPLMLAAGYGHVAVAKLLVETYRCDVNEEDSKSMTPVMWAARYDHLPVVKMLLEHGANVLHKGPDGLDCFLLACKEGHQEIVRELLAIDEVDRNVVDKDGRGALHLACQGGHTELVRMLVKEFRFPPDTRDNHGRTPLDLAEDHVLADIFEALHLNDDSSAPQPHESALEEACWINSGIESHFVTSFGGDFPLVPVGGEEDAKQLIHLQVPPGAVRADGEGMVEIRYAVIPDGPFQIPEGYKLCSTTVYINYSSAQTTKPFLLSLPHWSGAADHPVFVTSPHTLPEGEQYYPFHLLEGGEFGEGYGIVEVDGHCSLFALAFRLKDTSRYYASLWEREEGNSRHSRVAISFADSVWIQILTRYWKKWKKQHNVQFRFVGDHIEGNLDVERGRGWDTSTVGPNRVSAKDVEFKRVYRRRALKEAVIEEVYPPSITVKAVHSTVPEHHRCPRLIHLLISGAKSGRLTFPVEVSEEKESSHHGLLMTVNDFGFGEMEVTQSRSKAAVSDRDPLSQPVHCCKNYAVLFREHVSRQGAGKGKAVLECVGLTRAQIKLCYQSNPLNEEEAIQDGLHKWQETQGDHCTWQVLLKAMKFAGIAEQHCSQLVQELHQWMQGST